MESIRNYAFPRCLFAILARAEEVSDPDETSWAWIWTNLMAVTIIWGLGAIY